MVKFQSLIPELSVSNIEASKQFYQSIGFSVVYERKENKFCFLQLEENQLMIEEINENWNTGTLEYPFGRGINLSMTVSNISTFYEKILKLGYPIFRKLQEDTYQVGEEEVTDQEFLIQDPDGYLLRFTN